MKDGMLVLISVAIMLALLTYVTEAIKRGKAAAEKEQDEKKRYVYEKVLDLADKIVKSLNQTVVSPLKESETLTFDTEQQKEVLEKAKAKIKKNLDDKSKELLGDYLNSNYNLDEDQLDKDLDEIIHSKVYENKKPKNKKVWFKINLNTVQKN